MVVQHSPVPTAQSTQNNIIQTTPAVTGHLSDISPIVSQSQIQDLATPAQRTNSMQTPNGAHGSHPSGLRAIRLMFNSDSQCDQSLYDDVTGRLDSDLNGLPKDLYISKLLDTTENNDDDLFNYRSLLATRAKEQENAPSGILKDRRNSTKYSVNQKHAQDCYQLNQFICGNVSDIGAMFKPRPAQEPIMNSSRKTPGNLSVDIIHDISLLKNTVASLQSEVHLLKSRADQSHSRLDAFSTDLNEGIQTMKCELDSCAQTIATSLNTNENNDNLKLSASLGLLTSHLGRLQASRNALQSELSGISVRVRDNSSNIGNLQDQATQKKNTLKVQLQEVNDKLERQAKCSSELSEGKCTSDNSIKLLENKVKQLDCRVAQAPSTSNIEHILKSFTECVSLKLDTMNNNLKATVENMATANSDIVAHLFSHTRPPTDIHIKQAQPQGNHGNVVSVNSADTEMYTAVPIPMALAYAQSHQEQGVNSMSNGQHQQHSEPVSKVQHQPHFEPVSKVQHQQHSEPVSNGQHQQHSEPVSKVQHQQHSEPVSNGHHQQHSEPVSKVQHQQHFELVSNGQHQQYREPASKVQHQQHFELVSNGQHQQHFEPASKVQHQQYRESVSNQKAHIFRGVVRMPAKSYILTGIALDSDQQGLEEFLEDVGIKFRSAKFLSTRRIDSQSAQIVVSDEQVTTVENPETWPEGIYCRPWLQRSEYRKRYYEAPEYE